MFRSWPSLPPPGSRSSRPPSSRPVSPPYAPRTLDSSYGAPGTILIIHTQFPGSPPSRHAPDAPSPLLVQLSAHAGRCGFRTTLGGRRDPTLLERDLNKV